MALLPLLLPSQLILWGRKIVGVKITNKEKKMTKIITKETVNKNKVGQVYRVVRGSFNFYYRICEICTTSKGDETLEYSRKSYPQKKQYILVDMETARTVAGPEEDIMNLMVEGEITPVTEIEMTFKV